MDFFSKISGPELVSLSAILAIIISEDKTAKETELLSLFFSAVSRDLTTIALRKGVVIIKDLDQDKDDKDEEDEVILI